MAKVSAMPEAVFIDEAMAQVAQLGRINQAVNPASMAKVLILVNLSSHNGFSRKMRIDARLSLLGLTPVTPLVMI
jgi:hypothetical protein